MLWARTGGCYACCGTLQTGFAVFAAKNPAANSYDSMIIPIGFDFNTFYEFVWQKNTGRTLCGGRLKASGGNLSLYASPIGRSMAEQRKFICSARQPSL